MIKRCLKIAYKILGSAAICFAVIILFLKISLPTLTKNYDWTKLIRTELALANEIKKVSLSYEKLNFILNAEQVDFYNPENNMLALSVDKLKLKLDISKSLFSRKLSFKEVIIQGARFSVVQVASDTYSVSGLTDVHIPIPFNQLPKLPFAVDKLIVLESDVHLVYQDKTLPLTQFRLLIEHDQQLKIQGAATVVGTEPSYFAYRANLTKPELVLSAYGASVKMLQTYIPTELGFNAEEGVLDFIASIRLVDDGLKFSTDFNAKDIILGFKDNLNHKIESAKGQVAFSKSNHDWQLAIKNLKIVDSRESILINDIDKGQFYVDANSLYGKDLAITNLSKWLNLPIIADLVPGKASQFINTYHPKGKLTKIAFNKMTNTKYIAFEDLTLQSTKDTPQLKSLSGGLLKKGEFGFILVNSKNLAVNYPLLYSDKSIYLKDFSSKIDFGEVSDNFIIKSDNFSGILNNVNFASSFKLKFEDSNHKPIADILVDLKHGTTEDIKAALPDNVLKPQLLSWLNKSIKAGNHIDTGILVRGPLEFFPFDKDNAVFEIQSNLENVSLAFAPDWPQLDNLNVQISHDGRSMNLSSNQANISQAKVIQLNSIIPDVSAKDSRILIDGKIASSLENGFKFINNSPLQNSLGKTLLPFKFGGDMELSLGLDIPLGANNTNALQVRGLIDLTDANCFVSDWDLDISELSGEIAFTRNSVNSNNLRGKLLDEDAEFNLSSVIKPNAPMLNVVTKGDVKINKLLDWLKVSPKLPVSGKTDYAANLVIVTEQDNYSGHITINSSLRGLLIDVPLPIYKRAITERPSELKIFFEPNSLRRFSLKYGDSLNAKLSYGTEDKNWNFLGGHLHLGQNRLALFREDQILFIDGEVVSFDPTEWSDFYQQLTNPNQNLEVSSFGESFEPIVELEILDFKIKDLNFATTTIVAKHELHNWNISFDGDKLAGVINIPDKVNSEPINLHFSKLIFETEQDPLNEFPHHALSTDYLATGFGSNNKIKILKSPIDLKVDNLVLNNKNFQKLRARFTPTSTGYNINALHARLPGAKISLFGDWNFLLQKPKINLAGNLEIYNITETLRAIGNKSTLHGARGNIDFSLSWLGMPFKIDHQSLSGNATVNLADGYIQGVNPGFGRILSLFNIDNMHRRLNFDFGDVVKDGYTFDVLSADLKFGQGKVSSGNLSLNGPTAKIAALGQAEFATQNINGEIVIMPNLTGSLPLAAAIAAGNPAVGAAVWVFDKVFGNTIQEISRYQYQLMGTWDTPKIKEMSNSSSS